MEVRSITDCLVVDDLQVALVPQSRRQTPSSEKPWFGCWLSDVTLGTVVDQSTQWVLRSIELTSCCDLPSSLVFLGFFNLCSFLMLSNGCRWEKWTGLGNVIDSQSPQPFVKTCLNVWRSAQLLKGSDVSFKMCIVRPVVRRTWIQNPAKSRSCICQFLSCVRTKDRVSTSAECVSCKVLQGFVVWVFISTTLWISNANTGVPIPDNECTNFASHSPGFNCWKDVVCLNDATKFLGLLIRHVTFLWISTKRVSVPLQHSSTATVFAKRILAIVQRHVFQCLCFLLQPFVSWFSHTIILIVCKSVSIFYLSSQCQRVDGFKIVGSGSGCSWASFSRCGCGSASTSSSGIAGTWCTTKSGYRAFTKYSAINVV